MVFYIAFTPVKQSYVRRPLMYHIRGDAIVHIFVEKEWQGEGQFNFGSFENERR
jgi:hypothetical protein